MSARPGSARETLRQVLASGVTGTYEALASVAGLSTSAAQATLKEMRRCGDAGRAGRAVANGRPGRAPMVYGRPVTPFDALAHVREVWR